MNAVVKYQNQLKGADGISSYIQSVNQFELLTPKEEKELARRYHEDGNLECAQKLIMSSLRFVVPIASKFSGYGLPLADLIQEGNVGLMKAVKKFDPENGVRLITFAIHWVKAEINDFIIKNWRLVKMATTKSQRKLFFKLRSAKKNLGYITDAEANRIASELDVPKKDVLLMDSRFNQPDMSTNIEEDDSDDASFLPILLKSNEATPEESLISETETIRIQSQIHSALKYLDDRSKDIIMQRWFNENGKTSLKILAEKYNITLERIRQIEKQAMILMKTKLVA